MTKTAASAPHPLDIPPCLRVTPEEAELRRRYWVEHPPRRINVETGEDRATERQRLAAELAEEARLVRNSQTASRREALRLNAEAERRGQFAEPLPGTVFSPRRNRWVARNFINPAERARILRELPTQRHREIFMEIYGAGSGSLGGPDVAHHPVSSEPLDASSGPLAPGSSQKAAGRVRRVAAPSAGEESRAAQGPPRVPGGPNKTETVVAIRKLLLRPEGVTLDEMAALGIGGRKPWSCSATLSTQFRNKGEVILKRKEKRDGKEVTVYYQNATKEDVP